MKLQQDSSVEEPARSTPVYGSCDVLVIGGGPAGTAAAVAAGRLGADTVLVERYNHLGGLSTGGLVSWIDRMTDWDGNLIVAGVGEELIDRCGPDATLGPSPEIWGSKNPVEAAYWRVRTAALRDTVHWSPTVDPEVLKLVSNDIVRESNVHTLMHCWVVATIVQRRQRHGRDLREQAGTVRARRRPSSSTAPVTATCSRRQGLGSTTTSTARARTPDSRRAFASATSTCVAISISGCCVRRVQRDHAPRVARRHLPARSPDAVRLGGTLPHAEDGGLLRAQRRRSHRGGVRLPRRRTQGLDVLPRERAGVRTRLDPRHGLAGRARDTPGDSSVQSGSRSSTGAATEATSTASGCVPGMTPSYPDAPDPVPQPAPRRARTVSSPRVATCRPTRSRTPRCARSRSAG